MSRVSKVKINVFYPFTTSIIQNALIEICFINLIQNQFKGNSLFFFNIHQFLSSLDLKTDQSTIKVLRFEGLKNKIGYYGGRPDIVFIGPDISLRGFPFGSEIQHIFLSKDQLIDLKKTSIHTKSNYALFIPDGSPEKNSEQLKKLRSKVDLNIVVLITDFNDTQFVRLLIKESLLFFCFYEVHSVIRLAQNARCILSSSQVSHYLSGVSGRTLLNPDDIKEIL